MTAKKNFPILVEQDPDGHFMVSCPVIQGCHSYGKTIDEALNNIQEAIELCLFASDRYEPRAEHPLLSRNSFCISEQASLEKK